MWLWPLARAARWFVTARTSKIKVRRGLSWWRNIVNETKTYSERVSKSVLTPTPLIWVMMTRWGRETSVEAEWASWVREMAAGCWMWEVRRWVVHSWSHTIILHQSSGFTCCRKRNERFVCITLQHFLKEITFQNRWEGWALRTLDLLSQMSLYF